MALREEFKQFSENAKKEMKHLYEKIKQHPLTCLICIIAIVTAAILLIAFPHWQVSGINNVTEKVTQENQSRATLAQILGGIAVGIGIYFAWGNLKIAQSTFESNHEMAQKSLEVAQEGQITERFTRAVDQLGAIDQFGNRAIEIRLGGIYALERIANESEKDHCPIMEILTAYVRKNSSVEVIGNGNDKPISMEIQAILTVIGRRKVSFDFIDKNRLDLQGTFLRKADLFMANLNMANLQKANLEGAQLSGVFLKDADLFEANLKGATLLLANLESAQLVEANLQEADLKNANVSHAIFLGADLKEAYLFEANLKNAYLKGANLEGASLYKANLEGANLRNANLEGAFFEGANLKGVKNLTVDQLSKVETLYNAELDEELEKPLRKEYPALFEEPIDEP